jgi:hypothetical protein
MAGVVEMFMVELTAISGTRLFPNMQEEVSPIASISQSHSLVLPKPCSHFMVRTLSACGKNIFQPISSGTRHQKIEKCRDIGLLHGRDSAWMGLLTYTFATQNLGITVF